VKLRELLSSEAWTGREPAGGAVAMLIAPVALWFYMNLASGAGWTDVALLAWCFVLGWPFAAVTMLCFGIPVLVFLRVRGKSGGPLALALGGALAGGAAYFTMVVVGGWITDSPNAPFTLEQLGMYALGAVTGAHCGLCYYAVAVHAWRRA